MNCIYNFTILCISPYRNVLLTSDHGAAWCRPSGCANLCRGDVGRELHRGSCGDEHPYHEWERFSQLAQRQRAGWWTGAAIGRRWRCIDITIKASFHQLLDPPLGLKFLPLPYRQISRLVGPSPTNWRNPFVAFVAQIAQGRMARTGPFPIPKVPKAEESVPSPEAKAARFPSPGCIHPCWWFWKWTGPVQPAPTGTKKLPSGPKTGWPPWPPWPPSIACTTRHLSIFGGILSTIVGNIVLALQLARQSLRFFNCPRSVSS